MGERCFSHRLGAEVGLTISNASMILVLSSCRGNQHQRAQLDVHHSMISYFLALQASPRNGPDDHCPSA
jgi:hypothetical protein